MDLEKYPVSSVYDIEVFWYHFESEGPKRKIPKLVEFAQMKGNLYNLAFGDFNSSLGRLDDLSVSANGDREKVLATVAHCVIDFSRNFPTRVIFAKGSTPARTRLYQMGISKYLEHINQEFEIYGDLGGQWQEFKTKVNYDAFLLKRKSLPLPTSVDQKNENE